MRTNVPASPPAFSILELLVALGIFALVLGGVAFSSAGIQSLLVSQELRREGGQRASDLLRATLASMNSGYPPAVLPRNDGVFSESVDIVELSDFLTRKVTIVVSWDILGKSRKVVLGALATSYENPNSEQTCDAIPKGDWKQLWTHHTAEDIAGGPFTDVDAYRGRVYVTANNSTANQPTFFVFNSEDVAHLTLVSSIDNDPLHNTGLNAVVVSGQYAYVASASSFSQGQLQVIDVAVNPPRVVSTYKMPRVVGTSTQGIGKSIAYHDGFVFLGLTKTVSGPEFNVIDVRVPERPEWVGGYALGSAVNAMVVRDSRVFLATPLTRELIVLSVADLTRPILVGEYDAPGTVGNGKSLALLGERLFLGRTVAATQRELYALDVSGETPTLRGAPVEIGSSVNGLNVRSDFLFLLTNREFLIYRLQNDSDLERWGDPLSLLRSGSAEEPSFDCEGNYFYIVSNDSSEQSVLSIITSQL